MMSTSYNNLRHKLINRHMTKSELRRATGMSSGTLVKLSKGEPVTTSTLAKIYDVLKCDIGDIISYAPTAMQARAVGGIKGDRSR